MKPRNDVHLIASLLRVSEEAVTRFYHQTREQYGDLITLDQVTRAVELYLTHEPAARPSPITLVDFIGSLEQRWAESVEESAVDYALASHYSEAALRQEIIEESGWPSEDADIMYLATYGSEHPSATNPIREKEDELAWELALRSFEREYDIDTARESDLGSFQKQDNTAKAQPFKVDYQRIKEIQYSCKQWNISSLIHFTRVSNLNSILSTGLRSRQDLAKQAIADVAINDSFRHDHFYDAICLSISFPNYKMFYRCSKSNRSEWVVLELDASILWRLDCAFCADNAASKAVQAVPLKQRRQVAALHELFADYHGVSRSKTGVPDHYTTNPQAEVLVFEPIPTRYIKAVHFSDGAAIKPWKKGYDEAFWCKFIVNQQYFRARSDYEFWPSNQFGV
jgi:hypothetical protein